MRFGRAIFFGVLGAAAISIVSVPLRALGVPVRLEMLLGTLSGLMPGTNAFLLGLAMHLGLGAVFGVLYGALFELVWRHGGAFVGMLTTIPHSLFIGMLIGFSPEYHPLVPGALGEPGPYFAHDGGWVGAIAFFAVHLLYGAIVGGGYGHVVSEREWEPSRHGV
jgi:hypothetical protein